MKKISISTCFNYSISLEEQLRMISNTGFNYVSLGGNYKHSQILNKENRIELKHLLRKYNLKIDTIHGCCTDVPNAIEDLLETIEVAKELGIPIVVIHAITGFEISENEINEKAEKLELVCESIQDKLEEYNVKIAIENLFPDNADKVIEKVLPKLNEKYFGFCYDSSHDQVDGPRDMNIIDKYSERIIAVHLSDRIKPFVDHALPGEGFIDFDEMIKKLKKSSFNGPVLLELMIENSNVKNSDEFLKQAYVEGTRIYENLY